MNNIKKQLDWLPGNFSIVCDTSNCKMLYDAYSHANECSPDPSTRNGAIITDTIGSMMIFGVNRFPNGIAETRQRLNNKETKYKLIVHAEASAIINSARHGKSTNGSILYCPFYACSDCAKTIIQGGIKTVVGHAQLMILAKDHFTWVKSIVNGWEMLQEAGVECLLYDGIIGVDTKFNGKNIRI